MTEPTIEQLIDELIGKALFLPGVIGMSNRERESILNETRSALLSRIEEIQSRVKELESLSLISDRELTQDEIDYAGTIDVAFTENQAIASLRQEADAWHKMADELVEHQNERVITNDGKFIYCRFCGQIASIDCKIAHSIGCPVKKHSDLTARYSHEKEGEG